VFRRVAKELADAGAAATVDVDLIASYAAAVADLAAVSAAIDKAGVVVEVPTFNRNGKPTGHSTQKPNPLLKTKDALLGRVKQLADALGIGPAARSRAGAPADAGKASDNKMIAIRDRIEAIRRGDSSPPLENQFLEIKARFHAAQ
jgi:P27 family predicted phage terminase small subunit